MAISSVTSKGQVTIPKTIREHLHLHTGDKVDFRVERDGSIRMYPIAKKVSEVFGAFASKGNPVYSITEIKQRLIQALREKKR